MYMKPVTVIILGGGSNALGQIRMARDAEYRCINIVEKGIHSFSAKSCNCKGYLAPHPYSEKEACLEFLLRIIGGLQEKPFLFFASDEWLNLVGENEAVFTETAHIPQSPWEKVSSLYNKKYLYRIAAEYGIPHPRTIELDTVSEIPAADLGQLQPPYITKPQTTTSQNDLARSGLTAYHRTRKFSNRELLDQWARTLADHGVDFPVLIQEFIPGEGTTLYTLTSYSGKDGELVAGSIGHKLRQFPAEAGRITAGILHHDDRIFRLGHKFLKRVGYHGLANTEFKYDARDDQFKLMEINTRLGAWNYSSLYAGMNLLRIAVEESLGYPYTGPAYTTAKDGYIWYNLAVDLVSVLYLNKKTGDSAHTLSYGKWRRSVRPHGFEALWDPRDPMPFLFNLYYLGKKFVF